jgi:hypothetical protein
LRLQGFRQTEIEDLHRAVLPDFDVGGFQVAVHDALFVRRFERLRDLSGNGQGCVGRNRAPSDALGEVFAVNELHHERADTARVFDAVNVCDVRVVQRREHVRFALETGEAIDVAGEQPGKYLERDVTI